MKHDKLTALASGLALIGLLSLSAVVSGGRRPLPPARPSASELASRYPTAVRQSLTAVGLLPVGTPQFAQGQSTPEIQAAQPLKVDLAAPLNLYDVAQCLDGAATASDLDGARKCLDEQLAGRTPSAQELGQWLCSLPEGRFAQAQVMLEVVLPKVPGKQVLAFAEEVERSCPSIKEGGLVARALVACLATQAEWAAQMALQLSSSQIFDPLAGTLPLATAQEMALRGNAAARSMLEEGARGLHGGSEEQILGAALLGLELQVDGAEGIAYLTGLVESQFTPGIRGMGSFLAEALLDPAHWDAGDPVTAMALLNRILDDERFRLSAGRALAGKLEQVPHGADETSWAQLLESASFKHLQEQVLMVAPD